MGEDERSRSVKVTEPVKVPLSHFRTFILSTKNKHMKLKNLLIITGLVFSLSCFAQQKPDGSENIPPKNKSFETEVVRLVNEIRAENGLNPLQVDVNLTRSARYHAWDMATNNYYDHATMKKMKNGDWDIVYYKSSLRIRKFLREGVKCTSENIAAGQRTPQDVMKTWMESPGHRSSILNSDFTHIGVGYYAPEEYRYRFPHYWVQNFRCAYSGE